MKAPYANRQAIQAPCALDVEGIMFGIRASDPDGTDNFYPMPLRTNMRGVLPTFAAANGDTVIANGYPYLVNLLSRSLEMVALTADGSEV